MADWQRSRLIPTSGIGSEKEAEVRATSALLAVLSIVRPLSKALLDPLGASKAQNATVDTFVEIPFKTPTKNSRPDGLIRVQYGRKPPWTALVEVKTGDATLDPEQLNAYWDLAREHGYDAVVTISNEMSPAPGVHPTSGLKVRGNSKVKIHHWSWFSILTTAAVERDHRGVDDPEQGWILNELIRYLEHPSSGALAFGDMGENWTTVRDAARDGTLTKRTDGAADIANRWDQLLRYLSLRLSTDTGASVHQVLSKAHRDNPQKRTADLVDTLCTQGTLAGTIRIPNAAGDVDLSADIRAQRISASTQLEAPTDRGSKARVTWLMRQLADAPDGLVVESWAKNARNATATVPLARLREDPALAAPTEAGEIVRFRLLLSGEMGRNRRSGGRSPSFVEALETLLLRMYEQALQGIHPWVPAPPKVERSRPASTDQDTLPSEPATPKQQTTTTQPPRPVEGAWWLNPTVEGPDESASGPRSRGGADATDRATAQRGNLVAATEHQPLPPLVQLDGSGQSDDARTFAALLRGQEHGEGGCFGGGDGAG